VRSILNGGVGEGDLGTVGEILLLFRKERLLELHQNDENSATASRFHRQTKRGNPQILETFRGAQGTGLIWCIFETVTTRVTSLVTIPIPEFKAP
jgi:hypothetical protein